MLAILDMIVDNMVVLGILVDLHVCQKKQIPVDSKFKTASIELWKSP